MKECEKKQLRKHLQVWEFNIIDEITEGISENILVSINCTAWLISNRSEMRICLPYFILQESFIYWIAQI